jgi:hypothetical protein
LKKNKLQHHIITLYKPVYKQEARIAADRAKLKHKTCRLTLPKS